MNVLCSEPAAVARALRPELDAAYARVLDSGQYVLGAEVKAFEAEFAAYCGVRHAIGVASGLDALILILRALDVGPGDEVIVPANTYIATWLAVSHVGAEIVPVEPDEATRNLDPDRVAAALTSRTAAIIAVHLYGQPADHVAINAVAERRGVAVIEDAAQAHGASAGGSRCGSLGRAAGFSFYPTKNLGAFGDGGAVTTDDAQLAERVRVLRNYGSRRKNENEVRGINSRLDELQAALLRVGLRHLDKFNADRETQARRYLEALAQDLPASALPSVPVWAGSAWHQFVIRHPAREALAEILSDSGVQTLVHYPIPPHLSAAYAGSWQPGSFPVAERLAREVLSLPIGAHVDRAAQAHVISMLQRALERLNAATAA